MSQGEARRLLGRYVLRQELGLLLQVPIWLVVGFLVSLGIDRIYARGFLRGLLTAAGLLWAIGLAAGLARRGARMARYAVASGEPGLARRAARVGAASALIGCLTLTVVLIQVSVRHADELLSALPTGEKARGLVARLVLFGAIVWLGRIGWRTLRWTRRWERIGAHLPGDPADRLLWAVFDTLQVLEPVLELGWLRPGEAWLYGDTDNVFVTSERVLLLPMGEEEESAFPVAREWPRSRVRGYQERQRELGGFEFPAAELWLKEPESGPGPETEPDDKRFADVEALGIVTASAFGQRRKTLRRSLAQAAGQTGASAEDLLTAAGIDPGARAETVDVAGFRRLAEAWRAAKG